MAKIRNRERLKRKLLAIPEEIKIVMRPVLEKGATDITEFQKRLVPVIDQSTARRRAGALRDSINWVYGSPPKGTISATVGKNEPSKEISNIKISIFAGNEEAYYARWVEFGTRPGTKGTRVTYASGREARVKRTHPGTPAQPFFYPPFRFMGKRIKKQVTNAARAAIRKICKANG